MIAGAEELTPRPEGTRVFGHARRPRFADCAPGGRMRLDAIACWLQDVAYDDVEDAALHDAAVWVVRRTRIRVNRFPRFGERFAVTTFCSGLGRMWAERRTDIRALPDPLDPDGAGDADRADVEAVSLWVHLEPVSWRPSPLSAVEVSTYSGVHEPRRVTARLQHPAAVSEEEAEATEGWVFRATERDIAGHINNAASWAALEDELLRGPEPARLDVEIEYRAPAQPGPQQLRREGRLRWLLAEGGELHASIFIRARDEELDG